MPAASSTSSPIALALSLGLNYDPDPAILKLSPVRKIAS